MKTTCVCVKLILRAQCGLVFLTGKCVNNPMLQQSIKTSLTKTEEICNNSGPLKLSATLNVNPLLHIFQLTM